MHMTLDRLVTKLRRLKGTNLEDTEDENARNGTATVTVNKEQVKVLEHWMGVTNFVYSSWYVFCSKE
jgi:hypothetical protein